MLTFKHSRLVYSVSFSSDGLKLASGSGVYSENGGALKVWDIDANSPTSGQCLKTLKHDSPVRSVLFSPIDNETIAAAHFTRISIWENSSFKDRNRMELMLALKKRTVAKRPRRSAKPQRYSSFETRDEAYQNRDVSHHILDFLMHDSKRARKNSE